MNIYEKINKVRIQFQEKGIKMGGNNKFAGYNYYELADILPTINTLCAEIGLINIISFGTDLATMTIIDTEKLDQVLVTSPMSTANLKGCHEVQNLGAVETYIRRYLYQTAYEIIESDALNATNGSDKAEKKPDKFDQMHIDHLVEFENRINNSDWTPEKKKASIAFLEKASSKDLARLDDSLEKAGC